MRIAQVSPLHESVPPKLYGGTERVVSFLTEELVRMGHDVTLFASGDSETAARLVPCCPRALRLDPGAVDTWADHVRMVDEVYRRADEFDILHFHIDYLHFPVSSRSHVPHVTTLHGRLDIPQLVPLYGAFAREPVVSISDAQRRPLRRARWAGTVHHGLPPDLYPLGAGRGGYLAFLGRLSPEKRADRAIAIARRVGVPVKIAAKIARQDEDYFHAEIEPLLDGPLVEYIGEIGEAEKPAFLGDASALLFPIDWPEPFGLAMIEAMACGTPVVAFRGGSVAEVIRPGVSGYVVEDLDAAVRRTRDAQALSREACRADFEARFTAARMAADYVRIYERVIASARQDEDEAPAAAETGAAAEA